MDSQNGGIALASGLAQSLAAVVPGAIVVRAAGDVVEVSSHLVEWTAASFVGQLLNQPGDRRALIETAAWNALNTVQDFVTEVFRQPWPCPLDPSASSGTMALPAVSLEESTLHMWYGERSTPSLQLRSIQVDGL